MEKGEHKIGNSVVTIGADNPFAPKPVGEEVNTVVDNKEVVEQLEADPPVEDKSLDSDVSTTDMTDITQEVLDSLPKKDSVETKEEKVEVESNKGDSLGDVYSRVAEQMKTDGYLLPDVEVPENATGDQVYNLYVEANKAKLQEQVATATRTEVLTTLEKMGVNESDIQYAMAIRGGADPSELGQYVQYEKYATIDPDDAESDQMLDVISKGMKDRGYSDERVKRITESLEISGDDSIREEFKEYQKEFKNKHDSFIQQKAQVAAQKAQQESEDLKANTDYLEGVFREKSIREEPLSDTQLEDIRSSIFEKNAVVEVEGKKYTTSEWNKFLIEDLKDFKTQMYLFKILKYRGEELEGVKRKAKDLSDKDFMNRNTVEIEKYPEGDPVKNRNNKKNPGSWFDLGDKVL